jgi:hypothetical protein
MSFANRIRKAFAKHGNPVLARARVRVGGRGEVFIPSEEIATLPEVQEMQRKALAIVNRTASIRQQNREEAMVGTPQPRKA